MTTTLPILFMTSGSTGQPKGVTLTHKNAVAFVNWCSATFEPSGPDSAFVRAHSFTLTCSYWTYGYRSSTSATLSIINEELCEAGSTGPIYRRVNESRSGTLRRWILYFFPPTGDFAEHNYELGTYAACYSRARCFR